MNLGQIFGWNQVNEVHELPQIYPLPITDVDFITTDILTMYSKILTDTLERTDGMSDDQTSLMWDNCVQSCSSFGLITLLARAMAHRSELYLVFQKDVNVIRPATGAEEVIIRQDYEKTAGSNTGVYISFKNFRRSDLIRFYIAIEYATVGSLFKSMNLSKAVQIKINDLRAGVSLSDAAEAKKQAQDIAKALNKGRDVMLDGKDTIETSVPKLDAINECIHFLVKKMSFYLGLPASYLTGEQTGGIGSTGENDMRAVERGLKAYFFSIIKPVVDALFEIDVKYKSQDFRLISSSMDVMKTFSLTDDTLISADNKRMILNNLFDLPEDAEGDDAPPPAQTLPPETLQTVKVPGTKA